MDSPDAARAALDALKAHWHGQLGRYLCKTPDDALDHMVNVWNAYNCLITFQWSRAASLVYNGERDGLGYRDSVQDIVAASAIIPEQARERLELLITGQCENGAALSIVKPFDHHPGRMPTPDLHEIRSDDCMWLFDAVAAYVKETGDESFLDKTLPYADRGEDTVLGHLRRAIEFNFAHRGDHGLPCGLLADWNDCIEFGPKGESVFVAFQLRCALRMYDEINTRLGRGGEVDWARERLAELDAALDAFVWDGQWFRRGTREDGSIIGTSADAEGSIFLNAQSWAVLSGYRPDRHVAAMDQVAEKLATEYGIMVCTPPFRKTDYHVVRAVLINEGQKENGGIFSHPQGWAVMAECALGRGDRALGYYRAYLPAAQNDRAEIRQIEPYVHCQSTHSRFSRRFGASRIPWLSGTATWSYVAGTQHVLGIRPDWDGLRVDPCVPDDWSSFTVTRRFRGKTYRIEIDNAAGVRKGVTSMTVAGQAVDGNLIPTDIGGDEVEVKVTMG
jgi:cellobiose phosphorylase